MTLTVTDDDGGTGTDTAQVTVEVPVEVPSEETFTFTGSVNSGQESGHTVSIGPAAQSLYVKLTWYGWGNDLRLRIYNPDGELVASVDESYWLKVEEISIINPAEGEWRVVAYAERSWWWSWRAISYTIEGTIVY